MLTVAISFALGDSLPEMLSRPPILSRFFPFHVLYLNWCDSEDSYLPIPFPLSMVLAHFLKPVITDGEEFPVF